VIAIIIAVLAGFAFLDRHHAPPVEVLFIAFLAAWAITGLAAKKLRAPDSDIQKICWWCFWISFFAGTLVIHGGKVGAAVALGFAVAWMLTVWYEFVVLYRALSKRCPDCAESVKVAAHVCRYCNYRFSPAPRP
jgi:uncharacterized membrane protein (DUF4010 family)